MTGIVAGTFPQSPLPSNPDQPPNVTASTSIATSKPVNHILVQFQSSKMYLNITVLHVMQL